MSHGFSRISTDQGHNCGVNSLVMSQLSSALKHSELTEKIIGVFYDVYNELGRGFLESTYAEALTVALEEIGLDTAREVPVPVWFRGRKVGQYYADLIVDRVVLLELKAARALESGTRSATSSPSPRDRHRDWLVAELRTATPVPPPPLRQCKKKIHENPCESVAKVSA